MTHEADRGDASETAVVRDIKTASTQVPADFYDEFQRAALGNSGTISAELRIAMRSHLAEMRERGRAA